MSKRDTDKLVKETPRAKQGQRTVDGESIRDVNPIVSGAKDVEKKFTENPQRNEQDLEKCLVCGRILKLNGVCECGWSREMIKKTAWKKFKSTGQIG